MAAIDRNNLDFPVESTHEQPALGGSRGGMDYDLGGGNIQVPGTAPDELAVPALDPGTLSASVRRLEARGLVERRRDPIDTRRVTLGLTRQGRALDVPRPGTVEAAADALLADASPRDLAATVRVLDRFAAFLLDDDAPT